MPKSRIANRGDYKKRLAFARTSIAMLKRDVKILQDTLTIADELAEHHQNEHATCDWHPGQVAVPTDKTPTEVAEGFKAENPEVTVEVSDVANPA